MARGATKQLKHGAQRSSLASRIVDNWGEAGGDVPLDRLISELGDVQRYDIVAALKELERAGVGEFLVGRAGRKARFVWSSSRARALRAEIAENKKNESSAAAIANSNAKLRALAATAAKPRTILGTKSAPPPRQAPGAARSAARKGMLEHVFHLRADCVVTVRLPADVSKTEVDRFCQFLRALPFHD